MTNDPADIIAAHDFRKPSRLDGGLQHWLSAWQQAFCHLVSEKWNECLAYALQWRAVSIEPARPDEILRQLPDSALGYRVALGAEAIPTLFAYPRPLGLAAVGGMLGDVPEELPADRDLTAVEHSLSELATQELVAALGDSQPGSTPVPCQYDGIEPRPQRTRLFSVDKSLIVFHFEVEGPFGTQPCWWLLYQDSALELFSSLQQRGSEDGDRDERAQLENRVREIPVDVVVRLGQATLHVSDLAKLRCGDVVILDQRISEPLLAAVAGAAKFRGWPGRVGSRQGFQIESITDDAPPSA